MTSQTLPETDHLDAEAAMGSLGGDRNLWLRVLDSFRRNQVEDVARITEACTEEHWEEVRRLSHSLKSCAASVGATRLQANALQLEELAKCFQEQGEEVCFDRLNQCLVNLQREHRGVLAAVWQLLDQQPFPSEAAGTACAPIPDLEKLVGLLGEFDTAALTEWERVRPGLPGTLTPELVEQLHRQILQYDFEEAVILAEQALSQLKQLSG